MGNSLTIKILFTMKAFAAAGIIAAASAASIKATPTPSFEGASLFDASKYYSYGLGTYEYPEFDHKEELTPVIEHPQKPKPYKTNNIDIFEHSESDDGHHHHGYAYHGTSESESDTSEDDHKHHKKHMIILTGEGPDGDHCHSGDEKLGIQGDYCGKDPYSDYSDSDYSSATEEAESVHFEKPDPGCGGELCARVDFDWNIHGLTGTLDVYQPYGREPMLLFDGDWDNLQQEFRWPLRYPSKYEVAVNTLPIGGHPTPWEALETANTDLDLTPREDKCEDTGATFSWIGTALAEDDGGAHLRTFNDDGYCLEDIIGRSMEIRGRYEWFQRNQLKVLACGTIVEVACPPRPEYHF